MADTNSRPTTTTSSRTGGDVPAVEADVTDKGTGAGGSGSPPKEIGGRDGPEPTRFGDWEKAGRCIDF
ncbi:DUF1674 domain-containing protein [Steroidobacter sp.]|uniref:DUF1674 domain-containing protein n=1 Tax=Steroidobacter sp. TaxID=1978227 RepID=UPI0039C98E93